MLAAPCVGIVSALCALVLTWLSAFSCAAQHDGSAQGAHVQGPGARLESTRAETARSELANFSVTLSPPLARGPRAESLLQTQQNPARPWLWLAASTTAALAASYAVAQGFSYRANGQASRALDGTRDLQLELDARMRNRDQFAAAQDRANFLSRVSDICLAGTVAATGATLLIWLTSKRKREAQQIRTLIGPMVVRGSGGAGGGLVLRNKF